MSNREALATKVSKPDISIAGILQRKCATCGQHTIAGGGCSDCEKKKGSLQRKAANSKAASEAPSIVHEVLRSLGQPLDAATRAFMEPRFGHDFSGVRVHTNKRAAESARAINALAYTVGRDVVFGPGQYQPHSSEGSRLMAHELAHVVQQGDGYDGGSVAGIESETSVAEQNAESTAATVMAGGAAKTIPAAARLIHRRAEPYLKKITVHLAPPQSADLEWQGTAPSSATGSDHFTVSTGKGYSNPGDDPGTCTRACCNDPMTQCAPPWNQPGRVGACCTYYGNNFWTGTPEPQHDGGWLYWTPIQPYYSSRGIALHQHDDVTGQPIGHGCVRMAEENAQRIYEYSNGRRTNVTIEGRAAPVQCEDDRRCAASGSSGATGGLDRGSEDQLMAQETQEPVPGLEGAMS
ncbi:MAG: DUF4157 domain-containing protein [Acidobacteriota bacterium]